MLKWLHIALWIFCAFIPLTAAEKAPTPTQAPEYNYVCPEHISQEVWSQVEPYLLPSNHPIKDTLDLLFSQSRVTENYHSVRDAGFYRYHSREFSGCTVSPHPALKGYWVKMFTDDQTEREDYVAWIKRIKGARAIQRVIDKEQWNHLFKVPKKWIYPLPAFPEPKNHKLKRKNFILIVEDMRLHGKTKNYSKWLSKEMTKERLDALWTVMYRVGLSDCIYAFNVPFSKDGRLAFIDTEHNHRWPIHFNRLEKYLGPSQQKHWQELIKNGGPAKTP